jgi:hypothetical protein
MGRRESIGVVSAGRCPEAAGLMHARCLRFHPLWLTGSRPPSGGAVSVRLPLAPFRPVLPRPPRRGLPGRGCLACGTRHPAPRLRRGVPGQLPPASAPAASKSSDGVPRRQCSLAVAELALAGQGFDPVIGMATVHRSKRTCVPCPCHETQLKPFLPATKSIFHSQFELTASRLATKGWWVLHGGSPGHNR